MVYAYMLVVRHPFCVRHTFCILFAIDGMPFTDGQLRFSYYVSIFQSLLKPQGIYQLLRTGQIIQVS